MAHDACGGPPAGLRTNSQTDTDNKTLVSRRATYYQNTTVLILTRGFDVAANTLHVVTMFDYIQRVTQSMNFYRCFAQLRIDSVALSSHLLFLERVVNHHLFSNR